MRKMGTERIKNLPKDSRTQNQPPAIWLQRQHASDRLHLKYSVTACEKHQVLDLLACFYLIVLTFYLETILNIRQSYKTSTCEPFESKLLAFRTLAPTNASVCLCYKCEEINTKALLSSHPQAPFGFVHCSHWCLS